MRARRPRLVGAAFVAGLLLVPACHGRTLYQLPPPPAPPSASVAAAPPPVATAPRPPLGRRAPRGNPRTPGAQVFLSDRDLAPVDAFISARNAQWVLGDEVQVVASREYFAQVLTVNSAVGMVQRTETTRAEETIVDLVYVGPPGSVNVTTSPRIMIGTGLTITARRRLTLHLVKTANANVPVSLRITAQGDAVRGRKDDVLARQPMLSVGGDIRRQGAQWVWVPIGVQ